MKTIDEKKKERCLKRLKECAENGDTEEAHCQADEALLKLIGDSQISRAYNAVDKWYA